MTPAGLLLQEEIRRDKEDVRRYMKDLSVANRKLQTAALTDPLVHSEAHGRPA